MVGRPFTRQQIDQNLNIKQRQTILTGDQKHTDHFATGQLISRHSSQPNVFYFFFPPHFFKNNFSQPHKRHIWFCPDTQTDPSQNQKSHFFAIARHKH